MKIFLIISLIYLIAPSGYSQINILDASTIAHALKENAHSIKRDEKIEFEVKDIDNAKLTVHRVITVLDAEGEDALYFYQSSDEFTKLENAEIKVYDANGKAVNKYKMKEMNSQATGDGLVVDGKVYYFRVAAPSYPVTAQFDYEFKYKGTLNYPNYRIEWPDQSVEHSSYTAIIPKNLDFKFKDQNISIIPSIKTTEKNKIYTWEVKDLPAIKYEAESVSYESSYPAVLLTPGKFSMDGNEGDLSSWKSFGEWYANLSKGSLNLSEETKKYLNDLVKNASGNKEKIKIIYDYLQNNFRYVSIQLGIGGYKPFDANFVDKKKYGDCKALSNYMAACLGAVGITSYPALINADYNREPVDPGFPHNSFNHVILCVPGNKDTTWLECTNNIADVGVLGSFTENRNALLITPNGGVLVPTPKSKSSENTFDLITKVQIKEDASGESESILKTSGEYKEDLIYHLNDEKRDNQKKYLVSKLGFLQPDDFELTIDPKDDSAKTTFKLLIEKIPAFTAGNKMFLSPRIYNIWNVKLPNSDVRTKPFYFNSPFIKRDTTIYYLPEDYTAESLPSPRDTKFDFGEFKTNYIYDQKANTITTIAFLKLSQYLIPANKFIETKHFLSRVNEEFSEKIIIKKRS